MASATLEVVMNYDDMIARRTWNGPILELRLRMADYEVDGKRLGSIDWPTRSGAQDNPLLDKWSNEVLGVALMLGLLGHEGVRIVTEHPSGLKLERPDLDVRIPGYGLIGLEQADVTSTAQGKHEAETAALIATIRDLLNRDPLFARAFGTHYVTVFLSSPVAIRRRLESKSERLAIQGEIEQFIRAGEHRAGGSAESFPQKYQRLHSRGATWHSTDSPIPYFNVGYGAADAITIVDIKRVLDNHRGAAAAYREMPLWIALQCTDRWGFLRRTLEAVAAENLSITPFERCYLTDDGGRVLELRRGRQPTFVGMFAGNLLSGGNAT